jgi:hypothetical protein
MIEIITNNLSEGKTTGRSKYDSQSDGAGTFLFNGKSTKAQFKNKTKNGRNFILVNQFDKKNSSFIVYEDDTFIGVIDGATYLSRYGLTQESQPPPPDNDYLNFKCDTIYIP